MRVFYDKRLCEELPGDSLGDEFKGYVFKITGGFDKQGFPMMQGVMINHRTRLLLDGRTGSYTPKRDGCRKRKSVRGCIIGQDMSCINLIITKRGPVDLPKLTDKASEKPSTRGPKRANHIRKAWGLSKKEDVRNYVVKRTVPGKDGKESKVKSPKIQRLITPVTRRRTHQREIEKKKRYKKSQKEASDYQNLLNSIRQAKRATALSSKRATMSSKLAERKSTKMVVEKVVPKKEATTEQKGTKRPAEKPLRKKGIQLKKPKLATEAKPGVKKK